jgi:L-amino acid N-acyltransferase YncA
MLQSLTIENIAVGNDNYGGIPEKWLKQTAVLRWGRQPRKPLAKGIGNMRRDPFGFTSFYVFALAGKKVVGFAYFCRDESDAAQWYCGDLVVHKKCRRRGVAKGIVGQGIRAVKERGAMKLFTHIDSSNEASLSLHERLSFVRSERREQVNGFILGERDIIFERVV